MSFKKYLENEVGINPAVIQPINTPPEGMMMVGPKIIPQNTQTTILEVFDKEGSKFIILNENFLKETFKNNGIIISNGFINYEPMNKTISFEIQDIAGQLNLDQFHYVEKVLQFYAILNIKVEPENARITIFVNPEYNLGGIKNA